LRQLEGGCQVPIGVNTHIEADQLTLTGLVASLDGQHLVKDEITGNLDRAEGLGIELAESLKEQGAADILAKIFEQVRPGT